MKDAIDEKITRSVKAKGALSPSVEPDRVLLFNNEDEEEVGAGAG